MLSLLKFLLMLFLMVVALLAGGYFYTVEKINDIDQQALRPDRKIYTIALGTSPQTVINDLVLEPEHQLFYRIWFKLNPHFASLKAGTYSLENARNLREAFEILTKGKELAFYFTIVEGLRYEQIMKRLAKQEHLEFDLEEGEIPAFFKLNASNPEGLLFAETYRYTVGDRASQILMRSYTDLENYLLEQWNTRAQDLPFENPYQALILASIVEKETAKADEYSKVAAVFINRLKQNMRLQSDPTTIYGVKDRYDGNIRKRDLEDQNPYNTYVIDGLPPTPISIASRNAIFAVLHPADVTYMYFVADGNGGHTFSNTLAEHNRAVTQYLKLQRQQKKQAQIRLKNTQQVEAQEEAQDLDAAPKPSETVNTETPVQEPVAVP